jgi:DNA-binding response OmpR family regulator
MSRPVLVVEDDSGIREMLVDCLTDAGYHAVEAVNGMAALSLLRAGLDPGLILLDLVMPVMNGQEFLATWRAIATDEAPPVIVLTADQRENERAAQLGVAAVITKPMEIENLLAMVDRLARLRLVLGSALADVRPALGEPSSTC